MLLARKRLTPKRFKEARKYKARLINPTLTPFGCQSRQKRYVAGKSHQIVDAQMKKAYNKLDQKSSFRHQVIIIPVH